MSTPPFHNPANLTPEQYGAAKGWRLLHVGERRPADTQHWVWRTWSPSSAVGSTVEKWDVCTLRTRTPDPFAEKPAATVSPRWIPMRERKPTEADLPIIYGDYTTSGNWMQVYTSDSLLHPGNWRYWCHSSKPPAPPSFELTQVQKDWDAFKAAFPEFNPEAHKGWCKAIAYERAEIAKLIEDGGSIRPLIIAIRERIRGGAS